MTPYDHAARDPETGAVRVIIDTPAGSRNKYKFDEVLHLFRISRVLPHGMAFPHDFGSIPGTCADDGDPLDAMVLGLGTTFPGCLVHVRLIGVLRGYQIERGKRVRNDRLLATAVTSVNDPAARSLKDLDPEHLRNLEAFFVSYNRAQGRTFRITGRGTPQRAQALLESAERRFGATGSSASGGG
jgi:inorganic pyrophosphatase